MATERHLESQKQLPNSVLAQSPGLQYDVVRATMADRERIAAHLLTHYCPYEPMVMCFGPNYSSTKAEMDWYLKSLPEGLSLMAVDGDHIIGVAINGEITPDAGDIYKKLKEDSTDKDTTDFFTLWEQIERAANFWQNDQSSKVFNLEYLSVDTRLRGQGIGRVLLEHSLKLARKLSYDLFRIDCTSFYASRLAEMVGMTCVFERPFSDYKNEEGEQVYKVSLPHTSVKVFKQTLRA